MATMRMRLPALRIMLGPALALSACGPGEIETHEPYLLVIDEDEGTSDALLQISVQPGEEGKVEVLCEDLELPPGVPEDTNFTALISHEGTLYASALQETWGDTLMRIDPCNCTATLVGEYGFEGVSGLATTRDGRLLGLSAASDLLIEIDPPTGNAEQMIGLTADWSSVGLSASKPEDNLLYGIDASANTLQVFDGSDGSELETVALSKDFGAVGLEYHWGRERLYACGVVEDSTSLYRVDIDSGEVSLVAEGLFTTACDNMAIPLEPFHCIQ